MHQGVLVLVTELVIEAELDAAYAAAVGFEVEQQQVVEPVDEIEVGPVAEIEAEFVVEAETEESEVALAPVVGFVGTVQLLAVDRDSTADNVADMDHIQDTVDSIVDIVDDTKLQLFEKQPALTFGLGWSHWFSDWDLAQEL